MEEKRYLPSYGPFSEEEAIARIDKFEEELAQGKVKWFLQKKPGRNYTKGIHG